MKKRNLISALTVLIGFVGMITFAQMTQAASINVYRLYNVNTGEHFYTASAAEETVLNNNGWNYEGTAFVASTNGTPVYRVYNPNAKGGDHYYTKSVFEAQSLVNMGWKWDNNKKPVFYSSGKTKLYVSYNPNAKSGAHNYTTNGAEQNNLLNIGWKYGTVAWNVAGEGNSKAKNPNPTPHVYSKPEGTVIPAKTPQTPTVNPGIPSSRTVYVVDNGTTKVYWYNAADITPKPTHPVISMTEAEAIARGLHHSERE